MTQLLDLVNFNADASCLGSQAWLTALEGGEQAPFHRWLELYVAARKPIVLGLTGATIADLHAFNPQAIELINRHPDVFELIVRPFAHDIALLRTREGYLRNLALGMHVARQRFARVIPFFLPPEFMLTNEQAALLVEQGVGGVAVNASRFSPELRERIPGEPYLLKAIGGAELPCLPVQGSLTQAYLDSLHAWDAGPWQRAIAELARERVVSWRDGESPFLIPDGIERERVWLAGEQGIERVHLSALQLTYRRPDVLGPNAYQSYPVHSFTAWMKEFRMLGYVTRLSRIEEQLHEFDADELTLWLQAINSDVLSAVEKRSPSVLLKRAPVGEEQLTFVIHRSERGFEGEEFLVMLEQLRRDRRRHGLERFLAGASPHARKLAARRRAIADGLG